MADRDWRVDAPRAVVVSADRQRLTEALLNLVDNAIDATGPDDVVEIGAGAARRPARSSSGCATRAAASTPRRTWPTSSSARRARRHRRAGSTGLGLPIVAGIAAAHGGSAVAVEPPGPGHPRHGSGCRWPWRPR